jgi:hypothetical protein
MASYVCLQTNCRNHADLILGLNEMVKVTTLVVAVLHYHLEGLMLGRIGEAETEVEEAVNVRCP